jgi:hypothetical protein
MVKHVWSGEHGLRSGEAELARARAKAAVKRQEAQQRQ